MKRGEIINGYKILQNSTTAGGGLSEWSFAEREGKQYFIKQFLSPTYPVEGAPGSAKTKLENRKRCEEFEGHQNALKSKLAGRSTEGGNLIVTLDFFCFGARYYKVTEKIDVASMEPKDICMLPMRTRV